MGTPLGPKYILYTYMDPLGYSPGLSSSRLLGTVASAARTGDAPGAHSQHYRGYIRVYRGIYRDNGKENGNYRDYRGYIGE